MFICLHTNEKNDVYITITDGKGRAIELTLEEAQNLTAFLVGLLIEDIIEVIQVKHNKN